MSTIFDEMTSSVSSITQNSGLTSVTLPKLLNQSEAKKTIPISFLNGASTLVILLATSLISPTIATSLSEPNTAINQWHISTEADYETLAVSKSVTEEDIELDSPNWLNRRLAKLEERSFSRLNNPRIQRN